MIRWCQERAALHAAQSSVSRERHQLRHGVPCLLGLSNQSKLQSPHSPPAPLPLEELLAVDDSGWGERVSFSFDDVTTGRLLTPTNVPRPNLCAYEPS